MRIVLLAGLMALLVACGGATGARVEVVAIEDDPTPTSPAVEESIPASATLAATATATQAPDRRLVLAAVGDVMLARTIGERVLANGPAIVFEGVRDVLAGADIAFANLETSVSDTGAPQAKGYTFRAPPETVAALTDGGIDVVSLANNHALDYGPDALLDTRQRVEAAGIAVVGAGENVAEARGFSVVEREGLRVAFLAYVETQAEGSYRAATWDAGEGTPGVAWASLERITEDVALAEAAADLVIVSLHVGIEYSTVPSDLQRQYARAAIDAGASVVLGHHAHVLQEVEEYGGGVIAYSLGNFVFDGFDGASNTTAIFRAVLTPEGVESWEMVPVAIVENGLPVLDR